MESSTIRRAVVFHGYGAQPQDHWFPWLAEQLELTGVSTHVPALPNPAFPDRRAWAAAASEFIGVPQPDSLVVAHSLGCLAVLRHLASLDGSWRLGALVLVAGFVEALPTLPNLDDFIGEGANVAELAAHVESLTVLRSDDDPYVPLEHTDRLARLLGTSARVIPRAGHFLADDGVESLPGVLEALPADQWARS